MSNITRLNLFLMKEILCFIGYNQHFKLKQIALNKKIQKALTMNSILWENYSFAYSFSIEAHKGFVLSLFELKNKMIVSSGSDGTLKAWKFTNNYIVQKACVKAHLSAIRKIIESKEGLIFSASDDRTIKNWKLNDKCDKFSLISTLNGHSGDVYSLIQSNEGSIISCSLDTTIKLWENKNTKWEFTNIFKAISGILQFAELSTNELIFATKDHQIGLVNLETKNYSEKLSDYFKAHEFLIYSLVVLSKDMIASGSLDFTIKIWQKNIKFSLHLVIRESSTIATLTYLKSKRILSGSFDRNLVIWKKNKGVYKKAQVLTGHKSYVMSTIELSDGRLLSGSCDYNIIVWK